jgi:hypothetical protein
MLACQLIYCLSPLLYFAISFSMRCFIRQLSYAATHARLPPPRRHAADALHG